MNEAVFLCAEVRDFVLHQCAADAIENASRIQALWSDFGQIVRLDLSGAAVASVILKQVQLPVVATHPRGWSGRAGVKRKRDSYIVEANWYEQYAAGTPQRCRVPAPIAVQHGTSGTLILMEDVDAHYPQRCRALAPHEAGVCLDWLAAFHAHYLGHAGNGLWPIGTYWHLGTRADEHDSMAAGRVKTAASRLDRHLRGARFQTLVHGDAKLANFCFSTDKAAVAAVDFQYIGRGPGICDVVYFLGSCLDDAALSSSAPALLDHYFSQLEQALVAEEAAVDIDALTAEWRALYPIAWVDFYRFLLGWAPGHGKINAYTRQLADEVLGT